MSNNGTIRWPWQNCAAILNYTAMCFFFVDYDTSDLKDIKEIKIWTSDTLIPWYFPGLNVW